MSARDRLAQQVRHFAEALDRLEEALALPESEIVRDALIKRFEFSFEMAWKCMYRWLQLNEVDVAQEAFRVIPRAFSAGLIDDDAAWTTIRRARNQTSHTYDRRRAIEVAATAREEAAPRFRALLDRLNVELGE
jgi:nucleotidyltransferase substrate binding protein (TIGR01987 family)